MIRQIVWKEWHEQAWRFYFITLTFGLYTLIGIYSPLITDGVMIGFLLFVLTIPMPWLICMGVLIPDRQRESHRYLISLPISPRLIFLIKTVVGLCACLAPLAISLFIFVLFAGSRELTYSRIAFLFLMMAALTVQNYIWTLSLSVRARSEAHVAVVGVILFLSLFIYFWYSFSLIFDGEKIILAYGLCLHPFYPFLLLFYESISESMSFSAFVYQSQFWILISVISIQTLISIILWYCASCFYSRVRSEKA